MNKNTDMKTPMARSRKGGLAAFLGQRKFRYGTLALVMTAVIIAIVIILNVAVGAIEKSRALTIDFTAMNVTDFDQVTYDVVDTVTDDVYIYSVYQTTTTGSLRVQIDSVLEKYSSLNGHIHIGNIDPISEPTRISKFSSDSSLSEGSVIVTNADETRYKVLNRSDFYGQSSAYNMSFTYFRLESSITTALIYVTSSDTPHVYFLTGHGELDQAENFNFLTQSLQSRNYDVTTLNLIDSEAELKQGDTLIIANPQKDLTDDEYATLSQWLSAGGRMLVSMAYNTDTSVLPHFTSLLDYYQLSFGEGVLYEDQNATSNYWNGDVMNLIPVPDAEHDITKDLGTSVLISPYTRPINNVDIPESGTLYTKLLTTTNKAVVVDQDNNRSDPGTQTIALAMLDADASDSDKDVRIVLLGSHYMMADTMLVYYSDDLSFVLNAVDWLANSDLSVDFSPKYINNADYVLSSPDSTTANVLSVFVIVVMPLLIGVAGFLVWNKRRHL
ncbi:MAG: Gldg family protein [Clostridia bacterium]|nr:Gldg family protein [Clostridia bacterium]